MLVAGRLEVEALVLVLLTVSRVGVPIMTLNGKSRVRRDRLPQSSTSLSFPHCHIYPRGTSEGSFAPRFALRVLVLLLLDRLHPVGPGNQCLEAVALGLNRLQPEFGLRQVFGRRHLLQAPRHNPSR